MTMLLDISAKRTCFSEVFARVIWRGILHALVLVLFLGLSSNYSAAQLRETAPLHAWNDGANAGPLFTTSGQLVCDERRRLINWQSPLVFVRGPNYAGMDPTNWTPAPYLDGGRCEDNQQNSLAFPRDGYYCLEGYEPQIDNSTEARCCIFGMVDPPGGVNGRWQGVFASATPKCRMYGVDPGKNQSCPTNGASGGNPVNFGFPNKYQSEVMFSSSPPLMFTYNSTPVGAMGSAAVVPLGHGWTHTYNRRLLLATTPQLATTFAYSEGGAITTFNLVNGQWVSDLDVVDRLSDVLSGSTVIGRTLRRADDSIEQYDVNGRLLSITSRAGVVHTMAYNANGQLVTVTDSFGRSLTFTYHAPTAMSGANNISTVVDHAGNTISYTYDAANNLNTATFPGGGIKTFVFNEAANSPYPNRNALTGIVDENGSRFATFKYDAAVRPISTEHAGGVEKYQISYTGPYAQTVVTDPLGTVRTYNFSNIFGVIKATGVDQPCPTCSGSQSQLTTYDANGNVASRTDFNNKKTCYEYDQNRNIEITRVEGLPANATCSVELAKGVTAFTAADQRMVKTTWHATYRLPLTITEPSAAATYGGAPGTKVTTFTHDASGNVLTKSVSAPRNDGSGTTETRTWIYTYNNLGQVLTATDPLGNPATTVYYAATDTAVPPKFTKGDVHTVTNAAGHVTTFNEYDKNGRLLSMVDPNGLTTTMTYHPRGWLTSRSVIAGRNSETTNYFYDNVGQLTKVELPDGSSLYYAYDDAHRLVGMSDQVSGAEVQIDGSLRVQLEHLVGNSIVYTLDNMGNRIREDHVDDGFQIKRTKQRAIDALNRLKQDIGGTNYASAAPVGAPTIDPGVVDPATNAAVTQYSYDNNGNLTGTLDPLGRQTTQGYDALKRLIAVIDPYNGATKPTSYFYDAAGNLTRVTDPQGLSTDYIYNGHNNLISQSSPDTGTTKFTYNAVGNVVTKLDAEGRCSLTTYDALQRVSQVRYFASSNAATNTAAGCAAATDTTTQVEDTIAYAYDGMIIPGQGGVINLGRLFRISDNAGRIDYVHDMNGRVTRKTQLVNGPVSTSLRVTYRYNSAGQLESMVTPSGQGVAFVYGTGKYNNRFPGKLVGITVNRTDVIKGAVYEPFGPIGGWNWGNQVINRFGGSSNNILNQHLRVFDLDYRPTAVSSDPEGYNRDIEWDRGNRILGITVPGTVGGSPAISIPGLTNALSVNQTYQYDALDRLSNMSAGYPGASTFATGQGLLPNEAFTYDGIGNRLSRTATPPGGSASTATYAYPNLPSTAGTKRHTLTGIAGAQVNAYTYDLTGNTITESAARGTGINPGAGTPLANTYDARNRLKSVQVGSTTADTVTYTINGLGQRYRKSGAGQFAYSTSTTVDAVTGLSPQAATLAYNATYVYDEQGRLLGEYSPEGKLIQETIWFGDLPVATLRPKGASVQLPLGTPGTGVGTANNTGVNTEADPVNVDIFYIHPDHLGTPRVATRSTAVGGATSGPNAINKAVWRWDSDPFGTSLDASKPVENPQQVSGTASQVTAASFRINNRFPGQVFDAESGKQYNYFRDYDPSIGRYTTSDPIGLRGGLNSFGYANFRPSQFADPSGLITWKGSVRTYAAGPYSRDDYTLESECKCGHKAKVKVEAQAYAIGAGGTWALSNAEFEDSFDCPEPWVFDGPYFKVSAGISGGFGTTFSFILMGGARSPGAWGAQQGFDLSAGVAAGKATVQEPIEWTQCDCGRK